MEICPSPFAFWLSFRSEAFMNLTFQTISDKKTGSEQVIKGTEANNSIMLGAEKTKKTGNNSF